MSLRSSAAHSSRIKKTKPFNFKRASIAPSPYDSLPRRKPVPRSKSKVDICSEEDDLFGDRLDDVGLVQALADDLHLRDVPQAILYIRTRMFSPMPTQSAGMNSTRIADVLNFRKNLSPIVTISHIQALLNSPTLVEREIAEMIIGGAVRKMIVPGRGSMGEMLVLVKDLESVIQGSKTLSSGTKDGFIQLLQQNPTALSIPRDSISGSEAVSLMHAGLLTRETQSWTSGDLYSFHGSGSSGTSKSLNGISKAVSGSLAAVGGEGAIHSNGGTGGGALARNQSSNFCLAIPSVGPFLKLLVEARAHLVASLSKATYREMTLDMLRERWDGGIASDAAAAEAGKNKGHSAVVLPGRTRKWKQFYGLAFEFVLEECVGAGLIEVFETRSVGKGVRAI